MGWCEPGEKGFKDGKIRKAAGKLMDIVFWDCQRALLTCYIPKGVNMNSVWYCKVLHELKVDIHRQCSNLRNEQIFFICGNSRPHSSDFTTAFLVEVDWFIFSHSTYSPDPAPSDF